MFFRNRQESSTSRHYAGALSPEMFERFLKVRERELKMIEEKVGARTSVSIVGPGESGKSSLIRYCTAKSIGGVTSVYIDLQRVIDSDDFDEYLKQELSKLCLTKESTQYPICIYLDEVEALVVHERLDNDAIISYIVDTINQGKIIWVTTSHSPLMQIDQRLGRAIKSKIMVQKIPLNKRPSYTIPL